MSVENPKLTILLPAFFYFSFFKEPHESCATYLAAIRLLTWEFGEHPVVLDLLLACFRTLGACPELFGHQVSI